MDLDAYFRRIGFAAKAAGDLETLRRLHALHVAAIPFENLAAFLGEPIGLDLASLEAKLLDPGRGGWCFEHNLLFAHALEAIGFEVRRLAARVRWNVPEGVTTPRSHMLLRVTLPEGEHIADVGFGGLTLTAPLRLEPEKEQATPHESHRLQLDDGIYTLEAKVGGQWQALYRFDLQEQHQADYEVSNWYLAHHPQSQFVNGIIAARAAPGERHVLRNARYSIHARDGSTKRSFLESVGELKQVLADAMHLRPPQSAAFDARLQQIIDRESSP